MDDDNEYYDWDNIPCVLLKGSTSPQTYLYARRI